MISQQIRQICAHAFAERRYVFLFILMLAILFIYCLSPIFGDNENPISIPIIHNKINLDGNLDSDEWKNGYRATFPESRLNGQNVSVQLKYESNIRVLDGGFIIPGRSAPIYLSNSSEGIHFLFDVMPSANEHLNSDDHDIAFYRDGTVQYSIGDKEK
jgi:hypothetical protein